MCIHVYVCSYILNIAMYNTYHMLHYFTNKYYLLIYHGLRYCIVNADDLLVCTLSCKIIAILLLITAIRFYSIQTNKLSFYFSICAINRTIISLSMGHVQHIENKTM